MSMMKLMAVNRMKILLFLMLSIISSIAGDKLDEISKVKCDLLEKLLGEQLSGEIADYNNSSPEWRLMMESRIRYIMFTYWVNIDKFKTARSEVIEMRFGKLIEVINENNAFKRTFVEPHFIRSAESFPKHAYKSGNGDRFEINSYEQFEVENKKFLEFLDACASKIKK